MFTVQPSNLKQTHYSTTRFNNQVEKCARCLKSVYAVEEVKTSNKSFHKSCLRCNSCNKLLEVNTLTEHENSIYCKNCYGRNFGLKGIGAGNLSSEHTSNTQSFASSRASSHEIKESPARSYNHEEYECDY